MKAEWINGKSYLNGQEMPESEIWAILRKMKAYQVINSL